MNDTRGGDPDRIAPIIPLFGGASKKADPTTAGVDAARASEVVPRRTGDAGLWRSTWDEPTNTVSHAGEFEAGSPSDRHPARGAAGAFSVRDARSESSAPRLRALGGQREQTEEEDAPSPDEIRTAAEESLVRKLRARSLSVAEARQVLRGSGLDGGAVDDVIDDFCRRGYLDDAALAGMLVASGVERKGQGRVALARALSQRGIPRDIIDGALDELPDDDDERALEFARTKARSLSRLDHDTALRRLVGQLSRRGYNGAVAMGAAKTALREAAFGGATSGVRFVDSD